MDTEFSFFLGPLSRFDFLCRSTLNFNCLQSLNRSRALNTIAVPRFTYYCVISATMDMALSATKNRGYDIVVMDSRPIVVIFKCIIVIIQPLAAI